MNTSLPNEKNKLTPKLLLCLKNYTAHDFTADLIAGLTVGLVALPLAMAFGIASGVTTVGQPWQSLKIGFGNSNEGCSYRMQYQLLSRS